MAIKVSSKLIEDITEHINQMRDTAIKAEFGSPNNAILFYPCHEDAEAMDALLWGDHLHLKSQFPAAWRETVEAGPSGWRSTNIPLDLDEKKSSADFGLLLDTRSKLYHTPPHFFRSRDIALKKGLHPKLDALYDVLVQRRASANKWEDTRKKVLAVLNASPSLNQAAKVWPEIVHFLPSERKEQYKKDIAPKVRKKADTSELEAAVAEIDREAMAGDLVAYRFLTT
jgi:hypothetical protein